MNDATWLALTLVLTVIGAAVTYLAFRRRGPAPALRWAGITMLVPALYLTDALPLLVRVGSEIGSWATRLVFSPVVWTGLTLGGVGVLLILAGGSLMSRGRGLRAAQPVASTPEAPAPRAGRARGEVGAPAAKGTPARGAAPAPKGAADEGIDDDIEAILRKRGIT